MLPLTKASYKVRRILKEVVMANGTAKSTVQTVNNGMFLTRWLRHFCSLDLARTTDLILGAGNTLASIHPSMNDKVMENRLLRAIQKEAHPLGFGIEGL